MTGKPVPIDLVPYTDLLEGSREFLRVWASDGGPVTCFINPVPIGADPAAFGIALVDCVRHGAITYARATGISEAEALDRIWLGLDAERANPTDVATPIPGAKEELN
ncbi:DUF5076 domain-containing protein [Sphingomonas alpina]|uniref:DUF5076 domain-containing protein n=1 Tax=Sphingomonas alpina TaxID=653931 RepID=A0A7H0LKX9_9SPHN|nr:DUF5076 domain-containing protein [Sphingomonas alpina]QNQ10332.1 DUF5076 domain-containing protein [Sphingomonas alpina]